MPDHTQFLELPTLFRTVVIKMMQEWNKRMIADLSLSQVKLLFKLNAGGMHKASDLAKALCVSSGGITALSDKLIAAGFIERERDEEDRRVVMIQVTQKGREKAQEILKKQEETFFEFFGSLSDQDTNQLKRIFKQVLSHVKED
jgi:DNA-binding MarR family transcriptional regulator